MILVSRNQAPPSFVPLAMVNLGVASLVLLLMLYQYWHSAAFQYAIFAFLALLVVITQLIGLRRFRNLPVASWIVISVQLLCILAIPVMVGSALPTCLLFLAAIPLYIAASEQLNQLPSVLFLTLVAAAAAILLDLVLSSASWRLIVNSSHLWLISGVGFLGYLACLGFIYYRAVRQLTGKRHQQINVTTQYALVFTGISAMVIIMVTGVMIYQIRNAQIDQVGKTFQTIAENIAKLVGSHLEQQTQKLQLLTEQVQIFKKGLSSSNSQYLNRDQARELMMQKNRRWEGPSRDDTFIMTYRNGPIIEALSRFRGHNSFHNDLVLVDGFGGLVASLGQEPERFYFFDQNWWNIAWNDGLGNIFIGDLMLDKRTEVPKLRIVVDIVDHTTNRVIGMLSSFYLIRTLLEDMQRFRPDAVDQISLTDSTGRVIASTATDIANQHVWPQLSEMATPGQVAKSGWALAKDHHDQSALIGFSSLSTAYNVISDPLHRLGWHVVVSGSRANALDGVTQSTKLALLVGLVAIALGVMGAMAAARVITRPIENLTATASAMSDGDLDIRAKLTGPQELVALSAGFNRLTDRLHETIRNLKSKATQLDGAKSEAEAATKLKGDFLANMSHEIRTPLNAILGFADILEDSVEDVKLRRHVKTIKSSGADLLHLINDILDLSKIEAGRMELRFGPVNLRSLFDELQRIFSISAEEKMIRIEMEVAAELPALMILDRVRLRQVLFNLIGNAVKFTDHGYVRCIARGTQEQQGDHWNLILEVHDTGIGIDPEVQTEIFETFMQHHGETHSSLEGTGLGLSISKNLIEMMGGRIDVAGHSGKGSLFSIYLPDVRSAGDASHAMANFDETPDDITIQFKSAAILVADDLEVNRRLIIEALKPFPLKIDQAEHGTQAVTLATEKKYDLILMDIRMPDMDGYDALKRIRRQLKANTPPVIATTAAGMKEDIIKIQRTGFNDYLIRPFDRDALVQALRRYLPHENTRGQATSQSVAMISESSIKADPSWACPPEAEIYLLETLKRQWESVRQKQSIPDIVAFADDVRSVGEKYRIDVLTRFGSKLAEYAEGFDIYNIENLLDIFEVILSCRDTGDSKDMANEG